jgi:hypothetical protein
MKNSVRAACTQIRNVTVCGVLTFALAACGAGEESGSGSAAAAANQSLVTSNVGLIDRTPVDGTDAAANTPVSNTTSGSEPPATASANPVPAPSAGGSTSDTSASTGSNPPGTGTPSGSSGSGTGGSGSGTGSSGSGSGGSGSGTATLDWTPPTQNTDGSVLTNLAGYTVYYGTSPSDLNQSVKIANPGLSAYTMTNLSPGTWYFAVTSYSAAGVESTRTVVISARI